MNGLTHLMVAFFAMLGFFIGEVVIDLDHNGLSLKSIWKCFWSIGDECNTSRGVLHEPIVGVSLAMFFLMMGLGMMVHFYLDFRGGT